VRVSFGYLHQVGHGYAGNPPALAERVYGGRMGNKIPGDAWAYRGRGLKKLTGKENYIAYMLAAGVDFVVRPSLLLEPMYAADSASWFWACNGCSALADKGDVKALTMRINGELTGLTERTTQAAAALTALCT
jgi:putative chitinase